jgi:hypothetical protein
MAAAQRRRRWLLRFLDRRSHSGECLSLVNLVSRFQDDQGGSSSVRNVSGQHVSVRLYLHIGSQTESPGRGIQFSAHNNAFTVVFSFSRRVRPGAF